MRKLAYHGLPCSEPYVPHLFTRRLPQMRAVWDALLALAAVVQESRVTLVPLRQQYNRLADEAREFYTMAPEASKARALSVTEAMRVARVVNRNLKSMYESEAVFEAYNKNVQRVVDAYTRAVKEVKADLQAKLAGAWGGLGGAGAGTAETSGWPYAHHHSCAVLRVGVPLVADAGSPLDQCPDLALQS